MLESDADVTTLGTEGMPEQDKILEDACVDDSKQFLLSMIHNIRPLRMLILELNSEKKSQRLPS